MPEQITMFRAADGEVFDDERDAIEHDVYNAMRRQTKAFLDKRFTTKTMGRKRVEKLMLRFAVDVVLDRLPQLDENEDESDAGSELQHDPEQQDEAENPSGLEDQR